MAKKIKNQSEPQEENQSETEDNRLPYESPKLRKHGKINNTTLAITILNNSFDGLFGLADIS